MSTWRDTASQQAQADLDGLLGAVLGFAQQQLASSGAFYPFAAAVNKDGAVEMIAPETPDDHPAATSVLESCVAALTEKRGEIRACAVVFDSRLVQHQSGDAIQVDLEHAEGQALMVLLPYTKKRRNAFDYGPIRAAAGQHRIWRPDAST